MALENGMDVKTLSTTIGHVSSATTIDIYSHITDTMQRQAAAKIDRQIGGTEAEIPKAEEQVKVDRYPPARFRAVQAQMSQIRNGLCDDDKRPPLRGKIHAYQCIWKTRIP